MIAFFSKGTNHFPLNYLIILTFSLLKSHDYYIKVICHYFFWGSHLIILMEFKISYSFDIHKPSNIILREKWK